MSIRILFLKFVETPRFNNSNKQYAAPATQAFTISTAFSPNEMVIPDKLTSKNNFNKQYQ